MIVELTCNWKLAKETGIFALVDLYVDVKARVFSLQLAGIELLVEF